MKKISVVVVFVVTILVGFLFFGNCQTANQSKSAPQQTLYYNGDILTMEGKSPNYVEALVVENGQIEFTGQLTDANGKYQRANKIDLKGQTLVPGFIDGHSHFANFSAQSIGAQILPPPDAGANNIDTLISILKEWATPENIELTGWIFGMGFDDSVLEDKRFPTREDLDKVSTEHPIMIIHISGHFSSVNSKGLELLGITKDTQNPAGGIIRRFANSNIPNGVLEELAAIPYMLKTIVPQSKKAEQLFFQAGQEMAMSYGYTTAQEGRAMENHLMLANAAEDDLFKIDVVSYIDYMFIDKYMDTKWASEHYTNHYRIAGVKLTLDGSPQGRTAWRTTPYLLPPKGAKKNYLGYPAIPNDKDVENIYETAFKNNWQILTHANGDAAMDQMIRTMGPIAEKYGNVNRRNVLIHGQYVREDQLDSLKELNVIASLFPLHTFYWGDWHKQIIGDELGNKISPVRTALNKGLKITIHTDAPVALPNLMRAVWTAVNRTSRSGQVIGEGEKLTAYEALQAITIWSAYQHFEENEKGSIKVGKRADFVILDKNPLKVPPDNIKDIQVIETIKDGVSIYSQ